MKSLGEKLNIMGTPKIFIVDKKENKIIDVIDGANLEKINSYLDKDKQ
ncbi:DsbC family protein, partial [Campylobacter coli]|nr:DsbC family protein [Campylobacter coli]